MRPWRSGSAIIRRCRSARRRSSIIPKATGELRVLWPESPVRLVATEQFGDSLLVPADAEIVLEGRVPRNRLEPEGPFGEYTGYAGEATESPVFILECITHRGDAIYHDIASGLEDALVPDDMLNEARLFDIARGVTDAVGRGPCADREPPLPRHRANRRDRRRRRS